MNEQKLRKKIIEQFVTELSHKLGRSEEELLLNGLLDTDFHDDVFIEYEDSSTSNFRSAFYVENEKYYGVFTEHCSYHVFEKDWLNLIEQYGESAQKREKSVRVKWAGPNTPFISLESIDERLYPTKRELLEIQEEIGEFVKYYASDFLPTNIDNTDIGQQEDGLENFEALNQTLDNIIEDGDTQYSVDWFQRNKDKK